MDEAPQTLSISLIVTSYNEENNVREWATSLLAMTSLPYEIILADSGSTDNTLAILDEVFAESSVKLRVLHGRCTIPEGRNNAMKAATCEKFAITDFGVVFHPDWLQEIYDGLCQADWVGGYYQMKGKNAVQHSYCRLFDRPAGKVDEKQFLPSSRSFGIRQSLFETTGGYDETLPIGEDTDFVLRLRAMQKPYLFLPKALVTWFPRDTLKKIFTQHYKYAFWDGRAGQNNGRLIHVFMAFALVILPIFLLALSPVLAVICAAISIGMICVKIARNVHRNKYKPRLKGSDVCVYVAVILGSSIGYLSGLFSSFGRRFSKSSTT